ncbi:hypothetical protein [Thalassotalea sp. SU-HH00458]|uniref:anti-sigma factor family protein n=1 Tax=Thalassotalea sp. SU-HH00458 TaxID=3127657 RepID=UPI003109ED91
MKNLPYNDEILSAFLDAELPEAQMEEIRQAIQENEQLAEQLSRLAMVDSVIAQQYEQINQQPLPASITQLLEALPEANADHETIEKAKGFSTGSNSNIKDSNNVVSLSLWRRSKQAIKEHYAIAASFTAMCGFASALFVLTPNENAHWQEIAALLEVQTSGASKTLPTGETFSVALTFENAQGDFCRKYTIEGAEKSQQSLACRVNEQWQPTLTLYQNKSTTQQYQTATTQNMVREYIDKNAVGDFLTIDAEKQVIKQNWREENK